MTKMVCELKIRQMERKLGRRLTEEEKRKIREKAGHVDINGEEIENKGEEILVPA